MNINAVGGPLLALIVVVVLFLVIRRFWLWYWGVTEIQRLLTLQVRDLRELQQTVVATNVQLAAIASQLPPGQGQPPETPVQVPPASP